MDSEGILSVTRCPSGSQGLNQVVFDKAIQPGVRMEASRALGRLLEMDTTFHMQVECFDGRVQPRLTQTESVSGISFCIPFLSEFMLSTEMRSSLAIPFFAPFRKKKYLLG